MVNIILIKKKIRGTPEAAPGDANVLEFGEQEGRVIPLLREVTLGVVLEKQRRRNL